MSADTQPANYHHPALEFKSSSLTVPVLVLFSNDLTLISTQLDEKLKQAPEFFKNSPILVDLKFLTAKQLNLEFVAFIKAARDKALIPIGIRGGSPEQTRQAHELGLAVFSTHNTETNISAVKQEKLPAKPDQAEDADTFPATQLISHPIRSGQRIYAKGDLIVLAQVSAGAEIMAEGNIHVYGTLRGRALAGIQGNNDSRIFCKNLQAELVSIAGIYKISEDLDESVRNKPVQIFLEDQALIINGI